MKLNISIILLLALSLNACKSKSDKTAPAGFLTDSTKIVSLNGTVSEILAGLGLEKNIVGTDITSNFPLTLKNKPKIGHNRNINAEGVLALQPDLVIGIKKDVPETLVAQFKAAGVRLLLMDLDYSKKGAASLIHSLSDSLQYAAKGDSLIKALNADLARVTPPKDSINNPRVLFIYARGTGTMMVGGTGTQVEKAIKLAGGRNAITEFPDYKPLTAEALVKSNPDVILLFDSGLQSLGGANGLLKVQGIKETNAGKNKKIITMDGELLSSFGPRLGLAVQELATKIKI
jgi:iron complex transport system substrate-binding protein